jgi:hypothetical protein
MTTPTVAGSGTYYIKATTNAGCFDIKPVTVTINPLPSVFPGTGSGSYCAGGSGLIVGIAGSQVGVNYTLFLGVSAMSATLPGTGYPITFGVQTLAGTYWVLADNATTHCMNRMFNCIYIMIDPQLPVSVTVTPSSNPVNAGSPVTFTAAVVNGGSAPVYQWKVNGINAGSNLNTFTYVPVNGDEVNCVVTSNAYCLSVNPATSNTEVMTVVGVAETITVTGNLADGQTSCYNATQTITVAGGGSTFTVQPGASATMIAGHNIIYLPGSMVRAGGYMLGRIATNDQYCGQQAPSIPSVLTGGGAEPAMEMQIPSFTIYPNPTSGNFTLEQKSETIFEKVRVEIYSMRGERVLAGEISGERKHEFRLPDLPQGLYFVKVVADGYAGTFKLVRQK